jgi:hypothetical protein
MRPAIPEPVLSLCSEEDRVVVENVMYLSLEIIPTLSINLSTARKDNDVYFISIPFCHTGVIVTLNQLQQIQNYSPARVRDVTVCIHNDGNESNVRANALKLEICDGTTRIACTQYDLIRIKKRRI